MKTAVVLPLLLVFLVGCSHKPVAVAVPEAPPPAQAERLPGSGNSGPQTNSDEHLSSLQMPNRCGPKPGLPVGMALRITTGELRTAKSMTCTP